MSVEFIERFCVARKMAKKTKSLNKLTHLYITGKSIDKIGDISICTCLKFLYFHNNFIARIENLSNLSKLTHLYLQWNRIKVIENLNCLPNLKKLYLGNNEIKCLENIEQLHKLEELHLENQRLEDGEMFKFCSSCIKTLSKSLQILNIAKLNLENLQPIENLCRLKILIATENKFTSAKSLGRSLGFLRCLLKAHLHSCPAQKNIHYREQIIAGSYHLESLDEKDIYSHALIKKFEQIKFDRSITNIETSVLEKSSEHKISPLNLTIYHLSSKEEIGYKSWNTFHSANNIRRQKKTKNDIKLFISDVILKVKSFVSLNYIMRN